MILSPHNLSRREEYLDELIRNKTIAIGNAPQGTIRATSSGNKYMYYYLAPGEKGSGRYMNAADRSFAATVAQRQYDEKVIKAATREEYHLQGLIKIYESGTAEDIYDSLAPARRALVKPIFIPDDEFVSS